MNTRTKRIGRPLLKKQEKRRLISGYIKDATAAAIIRRAAKKGVSICSEVGRLLEEAIKSEKERGSAKT